MVRPAEHGGPCSGLRILDFTTVVSGPICTQALGDLGADVIKVETLTGDMSRTTSGPFHAGLSGFFTQFNRNKRSIALDLKSDSGCEVVKRLISHCDVLVENFRPESFIPTLFRPKIRSCAIDGQAATRNPCCPKSQSQSLGK